MLFVHRAFVAAGVVMHSKYEDMPISLLEGVLESMLLASSQPDADSTLENAAFRAGVGCSRDPSSQSWP